MSSILKLLGARMASLDILGVISLLRTVVGGEKKVWSVIIGDFGADEASLLERLGVGMVRL